MEDSAEMYFPKLAASTACPFVSSGVFFYNFWDILLTATPNLVPAVLRIRIILIRDPPFHFDADPDPTFHFVAYVDPDPAPHLRSLTYRPSTALFWTSTPLLCASTLPHFWTSAASEYWLVMRIQIRLLTLMLIPIWLFTLMRKRIRIQLPKLMRIRISNTCLLVFLPYFQKGKMTVKKN